MGPQIIEFLKTIKAFTEGCILSFGSLEKTIAQHGWDWADKFFQAIGQPHEVWIYNDNYNDEMEEKGYPRINTPRSKFIICLN